jgi:hypothetical protein
VGFQAVIPIGDIPEDVLQQYYNLIITHREVWPQSIAFLSSLL